MKELLSAPLSPRKLVEYLLLFLLLALVISAAAYGGYWCGKREIKLSAPSATSLEEPRQSPQSRFPEKPSPRLADETAGWEIYSLKTLNLEFKLPPVLSKYGDLKEKVEPCERGTYICMTFPRKTSFLIKPALAGGCACSISYFGMGANSVDFEEGRGAGFTDLQGYVVEKGKYYAKMLGKSFEIPANLAKELTTSGGLHILRVICVDSPSTEEWQGPRAGTPGSGRIGALVNTNNTTYPGIAIEMELTEDLTEELFDQILSTFRFLDQKPAGGEASPNIPSSWRVYDNVFGVTKFSFRYPETLEVWDDDPQSGSIYLSKKDANNNPIYVFLDTFSHVYGPYYFGEYKSGSRRAWFIENMKEPYPDVAFSDLAFKEVNFTGGKSYLQVVPWPVGEGEGGDFYFGVQNGIPFYVINMQIDEKILSKEDFLKILSTITVKK